MPAMQATRDGLLGLLRRVDRLKPAEVADVVLTDPLLTATVLRDASLRTKTSMSVDVVTIEAAVMLVGVLPFVERHARGLALETVLAGDAARLECCLALIARAQLAARIAGGFGLRRMDARVEELQVAALLSVVPGLLAQLHGDVADVTALLAAWDFPEVLVQLCVGADDMPPRQKLQQASLRLAAGLEKGWWGDEVSQAVQSIAAVFDTAEGDVWRQLHEPVLAQAHAPLAARVVPVATWLPMVAGAWPSPRPVRDVLAARMQALHLAGLQGLPANQIMRLAVRALVEGLQLRRVLLAIPQDGALVARFCVGASVDDPIRSLNLPLAGPQLFGQLMQRPQAVWLNADSRPKLVPQLTPALTALIGDGDFYAMSLFVGDKAVGMFFADRTLPLDAQSYLSFKQICQLTSRALAGRAAL
ncbi:hypothetical protein BJP62_02760 [Jeongeupia sp. USM3]|nr:hypothetical protein BJP62_02760 [Jeongeupia sp. USM3]